MMVILKLPIAYLSGVVLWAIRAEPRPLEGAALAATLDQEPLSAGPCGWRRPRRPLGFRPAPRRPVRPRRAAGARGAA